MNYILIADKNEADNIKIPQELKDDVKIILLGWGETSVIKTLSKLFFKGVFNKNDKFFNIGYVGSNQFPIASVVVVGSVAKEIPSHTVKEPSIKLNKNSSVKCYSSLNFVESTKHTGVFDMELYTLATFFPKIKSVKVVSDNLNYHEYKQADMKNAWGRANSELFDIIKSGK